MQIELQNIDEVDVTTGEIFQDIQALLGEDATKAMSYIDIDKTQEEKLKVDSLFGNVKDNTTQKDTFAVQRDPDFSL